MKKTENKFKSFLETFVNEKLVMLIVIINSIVFVSLDVNPKLVEITGVWITWVDYICVVYFILLLTTILFTNLSLIFYLPNNYLPLCSIF